MLAAIILRQTLPAGDTVLFDRLTPELQQGIKSELLQAIVHEPERYVRGQISDTVASLASVLIYSNKWPELFPALYQMCVPASSESLKVCALSIIGKLSDAADNLLEQVPQLYAVFASMLPAATNSLKVREAAAVACCKVAPLIEDKNHTREYQKLLPALLTVVGDALAAEEEDSAKAVLAGLTEVATEEGKFFSKHLDLVVPLMYAIGADTQNKELDDGLRQYACEVLIATAESAQAMVRKSPSFIRQTILVCLSLMLCVEEDAAWGTKQDSTDFYDNSNYDCGEMNMDRLAGVVKGTKLWPILKPILDTFVSSKDNWRMRHAGLFALAQTASVISFEAIPFKEVCVFASRDPHPRVRYAAIQCLGQFPVDFEAITQTKHHKIIYPALMDGLKDVANPRIQMHAASALLNMVEGSEPKVLKKYMATMMTLLQGLLKSSPQMVQEQVMPTMAALAGQAPTQFLPYYDHVMPLMKYIIAHASTPATRRLRGKAMESATYIGQFVGKEKFHNDAREIMHMFLQIQQQAAAQAGTKKQRAAAGQLSPQEAAAAAIESSDDDYSEQHMLQAWTRICACLREEFVPVLPYVMPKALEAISKQSEQEAIVASRVHKISNDGDGSGEGEDDDPNVGKDGRVKAIFAGAADGSNPLAQQGQDGPEERPNVLLYTSHAQTAAMEDKALAMSMLTSFCHDLQADFLPYVKESAALMIPLVDHLHEQVQAHAIAAMPHLFRAALAAHRIGKASLDFCKTLLEAIVAQFVDVMPKETQSYTLQELVTSLHDCIDEAGELAVQVIDPERLQVIGMALLQLLVKSHQRIEMREKRLREEEENDEVDEERIVEIESRNVGEDGLNACVASCIEALIKTHKHHFIPTFDKVSKQAKHALGRRAEPIRLLDAHTWALCF